MISSKARMTHRGSRYTCTREGQLAVSHSASNEVTDADATNPYQPGGDFNYIPDAVP